MPDSTDITPGLAAREVAPALERFRQRRKRSNSWFCYAQAPRGPRNASANGGTALTARAVANTTAYGGATVDPIAALAKWSPLGYHVDDDRSMRFAERSNVETQALKPTATDSARLKFAPPKHKIIYG